MGHGSWPEVPVWGEGIFFPIGGGARGGATISRRRSCVIVSGGVRRWVVVVIVVLTEVGMHIFGSPHKIC